MQLQKQLNILNDFDSQQPVIKSLNQLHDLNFAAFDQAIQNQNIETPSQMVNRYYNHPSLKHIMNYISEFDQPYLKIDHQNNQITITKIKKSDIRSIVKTMYQIIQTEVLYDTHSQKISFPD